MEQTFEYLPTSVYIEKIEIKDIGNTIIEGKNEDGIFYYLTIQTEFGMTRVCEFGPCVDGLQYELKGFNFKYYKTSYTESKCVTAINKFLKNYIYGIVEAKEVTFEDLEKYCNIEILKYIKEGNI